MTVSPFGFFQPDAIFARNLFGATPAEAVRPDVDAERLLPGVLRHIQIRLVERQRLDERRHAPVDGKHLFRHPAILLKVGAHDDQRGAQAHRPRHRNRRPDAVRPGLVTRRRYHAALGGIATDDNRFALERRIVALLDRRVERVHVDVEDSAHVSSFLVPRSWFLVQSFVLRAWFLVRCFVPCALCLVPRASGGARRAEKPRVEGRELL
jgi:hypothetical protein